MVRFIIHLALSLADTKDSSLNLVLLKKRVPKPPLWLIELLRVFMSCLLLFLSLWFSTLINQQPRSKLTRYEWAEKIILRGKPRGIKPHNVSKGICSLVFSFLKFGYLYLRPCEAWNGLYNSG